MDGSMECANERRFGSVSGNLVALRPAAELIFSAMAEQIMYMGSQARLMTADELLRNDIPNKSTELVRGVLVVREPPGCWHGHLSARLTFLFGQHVYPRQSGMLFGQDTGFLIGRDPDTVRAPDVAFVSATRVSGIARRGYAPIAPDLAVEILSPGDRPSEVLEKVADWLRAGCRLVWVLDPDRGIARVHRADGTIDIVREDGALDGEDVLQGFSCPLAEVLT
jgi:Uma2 family endonuclease